MGGVKGDAYTLLLPNQHASAAMLVRSLEAAGQDVPELVMKLAKEDHYFAKTRSRGRGGRGIASGRGRGRGNALGTGDASEGTAVPPPPSLTASANVPPPASYGNSSTAAVNSVDAKAAEIQRNM